MMSSSRPISPDPDAPAIVVDGLVRFSVGIEHINDIIADVDRAIALMHVDL